MCTCPEEYVVIKSGKTQCKRCVGRTKEVHHSEAKMLDDILRIRDRWHGAIKTSVNDKAFRAELEVVMQTYVGIKAKFAVQGNKVTIEIV